ncbi:MAG: ribbon-helix-helix domain-containing protein [Thermomicrobiales bacterium]
MSIQLTPQSEALIRRTVAGGRYASVDEALDAAVLLLDAHDRHARLKAAIAEGIAQIDRGEGVELTPELWAEIEREADEAERLGEPIDPDVCP